MVKLGSILYSTGEAYCTAKYFSTPFQLGSTNPWVLVDGRDGFRLAKTW